MGARTIESYGGIKENLFEVEYPTAEQSAGDHNRQAEDTAQMTRTAAFARGWFVTTAAAAPATVSPSNVVIRSLAGNGSAQKPIVTKTATGLYTVTFPETYTDALDVVETIAIAVADCRLHGPVVGIAQVVSWTNRTMSIKVVDGSNANSDVSATGVVVFEATF
jgi:hypothetical protein